MKYDNDMAMVVKTFFAIIVGIFVLVLLPSPLLYAEDVCVSEESAERIVVELEKGKINEEQLTVLKTYNLELEKQVSLMKDVARLKDKQIKKNEEMIDQQKQLTEYQTQACEEKVNNAKPSFFESLIKVIGGVGIGIIAGAFLLS